MQNQAKIKDHLAEHIYAATSIYSSFTEIESIALEISRLLLRGGTLYLCGNGGSASDAQHIAAELVVRYVLDRSPISAISLTTDTSIITACSNDYEFNEIFARQINCLCKKGDALLVLSTSGVSENIVRAVEAANNIGVQTFAFLGRDGGKVLSIAKKSIVIKSERTAIIQEMHIMLGHMMCMLIETDLGGL